MIPRAALLVAESAESNAVMTACVERSTASVEADGTDHESRLSLTDPHVSASSAVSEFSFVGAQLLDGGGLLQNKPIAIASFPSVSIACGAIDSESEHNEAGLSQTCSVTSPAQPLLEPTDHDDRDGIVAAAAFASLAMDVAARDKVSSRVESVPDAVVDVRVASEAVVAASPTVSPSLPSSHSDFVRPRAYAVFPSGSLKPAASGKGGGVGPSASQTAQMQKRYPTSASKQRLPSTRRVAAMATLTAPLPAALSLPASVLDLRSNRRGSLVRPPASLLGPPPGQLQCRVRANAGSAIPLPAHLSSDAASSLLINMLAGRSTWMD